MPLQMFCGWVDLNQLVMSRYDTSYIKYSSNDETRLPSLLYQTFPDLDTDQPVSTIHICLIILFLRHLYYDIFSNLNDLLIFVKKSLVTLFLYKCRFNYVS
jgi:hypothetical protein